MSTQTNVQTATVRSPTMMEILAYVLSQGYETQAAVVVSCQSTPVTANVSSFTVQYAQGSVTVNIVVTFPATCTGTLTEVLVELHLLPQQGGGYGIMPAIDLTNMNVPITAGNSYSIYIIETLTEPTTAQLQT